MSAQQPVARVSAGAVTAALWENEINIGGQPKTVLKASVARRYKDRDGTWKSTTSFSKNEIPLAIYCLQKAYEKIIAEEGADTNGGPIGEEESVI